MFARRTPAGLGKLRPFAIIPLLTASLIIPQTARADTDLTIGGPAVVAYANGDDVWLRDSPSTSGVQIIAVAEGSTVEPLDGPITAGDGSLWYRVWVNGETGYMTAEFLAASANLFTETSGTAHTTDDVNLRSGPGKDTAAITTIPAGSTVTLTGDLVDGWLSVSWSGMSGYLYGAFLGWGDGWATPEAPSSTTTSATGELRYIAEDLNLRTEPSLSSGVIDILLPGTPVELTGAANGEFVEIWAGNQRGWVAAGYLVASPDQVSTSQPEAPAATTPSSPVIWPVSGGDWKILQGYHGSSHRNNSDLWQYEYSLDLVASDGNTSGQPVYSPVNGTIRWYDPSTGGVSIDMGNGYAFAMFHAEYDAGIPEGATVTQGQYLGYISPPGAGANGGTPHLHITVWATDDGGNWSRQAVPFTGDLALSGTAFPDGGQSQDHTGETFTP